MDKKESNSKAKSEKKEPETNTKVNRPPSIFLPERVAASYMKK
jgi:hypothetical protein